MIVASLPNTRWRNHLGGVELIPRELMDTTMVDIAVDIPSSTVQDAMNFSENDSPNNYV